MIKFLKSYYYALLPILPLLIFWSLGYLLGYGGSMTKERITILISGGVLVGFLGYLVEVIADKTYLNRITIIGIISVNLIFWSVVFLFGYSFDWENIPFNTKDGTYYPSLWLGHFFNAIVLYTNALFLFPRYQQKKIRLSTYWLLVICLIFSTALFESIADLQLANYLGLLPVLEEYYTEFGSSTFVLFDWVIQHFVIHTFYIFISFVLIFVLQYLDYQKTKEKLEKEKLNAELKFLKAQINPHFLFNGINSVYHLIDPKPVIAKDTLLKFSNLLRYQLYECNDDLIPLEKELAHIQDYVEMEKIRKGGDASIQLKLPDETFGMKIPPLLFMPFIENAFKYVSNQDDGEKNNITIKIHLHPEEEELHFEAYNTVDENGVVSNGGIGIANVKKRLALLFPNRHDLAIIRETDHFTIKMSLTLK